MAPRRSDEEEEALQRELDAEEAEEDELERRALESGTMTTTKKQQTSDRAALERSVQQLETDDDFVERLVLDSAKPLVASSSEDLEREVAIYNMTLEMVKAGRDELVRHGEPFQRPADFFCEMLKSDTHMAKVKDELIFQQKKMDAFEQRKARQHQLKFAKAVQAEKLKERAAMKKQNLKDVDEFRRNAQKKDFFDKDQKKSKKRAALDKIFGFGGRKKGQKKNDPTSIDDMSTFHPRAGKHSSSRKRAPPPAAGTGGRQSSKKQRK